MPPYLYFHSHVISYFARSFSVRTLLCLHNRQLDNLLDLLLKGLFCLLIIIINKSNLFNTLSTSLFQVTEMKIGFRHRTDDSVLLKHFHMHLGHHFLVFSSGVVISSRWTLRMYDALVMWFWPIFSWCLKVCASMRLWDSSDNFSTVCNKVWDVYLLCFLLCFLPLPLDNCECYLECCFFKHIVTCKSQLSLLLIFVLCSVDAYLSTFTYVLYVSTSWIEIQMYWAFLNSNIWLLKVPQYFVVLSLSCSVPPLDDESWCLNLK